VIHLSLIQLKALADGRKRLRRWHARRAAPIMAL